MKIDIVELAAALGFPGGISNPELRPHILLKMVSDLRLLGDKLKKFSPADNLSAEKLDEISKRVDLREVPGEGENSLDCQGCGAWWSRCRCDQWLADQVPALLIAAHRLQFLLDKP